MNLLDGVIILVVALQAFRWVNYGLMRGVFSIGGFWGGVLLGALLAPFTMQLVADEPLPRLITLVVTIIVVALLLGVLGEYVGRQLSRLTQKLRLGALDAVLGAALGMMVALLFIWLLAAIMAGTPFQGVNQQLRESIILQNLNERLPPAPAVVSQISGLISQDGFPDVFSGLEPAPVDPVDPPTSEETAQAQAAAASATVRIESVGCGGTVNGSGFVASNNLVITNAHVVAGIERPTVVDTEGRREATVVYFDPDLDMAVLRTSGLAGDPLSISRERFPRGTTGAVLGYPGGGPLQVSDMAVLRSLDARGRDIYGQGLVQRPVYELQSSIASGSSGGPAVLPDGTVIGLVFARSEASGTIGYAIESPAIVEGLEQARGVTQAVSTGACAR